ncbi:MAG: hypothetical protein ACI4KB_13790 [Oscillospiraceae bacterium]
MICQTVRLLDNPPDMCSKWLDFLSLKDLFCRPHSYGDVFIDFGHPSHAGQKVIADKIFEFLQSRNFYSDSAPVSVELDIEPKSL